MVKYAHLADLHIGGWREGVLRDAQSQSFKQAVSKCIQEKVDFILIAGDFFNTSFPSIDCLKDVTQTLKELSDANIPVYIIEGSHDYSPSGKTIIDVFERAGLMIKVFKGKVENKTLKLEFTVDKKTGIKITGIIGKRGMLDREFYETLDISHLEKEQGYKIFMWHTSLTELKPKHLNQMESTDISFLPKGFAYYAGGHVHYPMKISPQNYGTIAQPGPTFPNNFAELEELKQGGFYIIESNANSKESKLDRVVWHPINMINVHSVNLDCQDKSPEAITSELIENFSDKELSNTVVLIRLSGELKTGTASDINFKSIYELLNQKSALTVLKNTSKLSSKTFEAVQVVTSTSSEEMEEKIINQALTNLKDSIDSSTIASLADSDLVKQLMSVMYKEREEGEKVGDFEIRLKNDVFQTLRKFDQNDLFDEAKSSTKKQTDSDGLRIIKLSKTIKLDKPNQEETTLQEE